MSLHVTALLSCAQHPVSGRSCRAALDARALELGLRLDHVRLEGLHAGAADSPALQAYLGMGLARIRVCAVDAERDAYPVLRAEIAATAPDLLLAGTFGAQLQSDGSLPYCLARDLRVPLLPSASEIKVDGSRIEILQALAGGRRRHLAADFPAIVTVAASAAKPRQAAFGRARRGQIELCPPRATSPPRRTEWKVRRAGPSMTLQAAAALHASPEERVAALTAGPARDGRLLAGLSAEAGAGELLAFLERTGLRPAALRSERHVELQSASCAGR